MTVDLDGSISPITRPRRFFDWDYFCSGGQVSSQIGRMGWSVNGQGTPSFTRVNSTFSNSSKLNLATSNVSGDRASLTLGNTESRLMSSPSEFVVAQWVWRMANVLTNKRAFFGWSSDFALDPVSAASNAFGVAYNSDVSPNYLLLSRIGATISLVNTGSVVPANTGQLMSLVRFPSDPTNWQFYIGNTAIASIAAPAAFDANHGYRNETLAAAVSTLEVAYWGATTDIIGGVYSSDDFLDE